MAIYSYSNEPTLDFTKPENQKNYQEGFKRLDYLGDEFPIIIDGERIYTDIIYKSLNPSNHSEVIGHMHQADTRHAEQAMASALDAFESWKKVPASSRADVLFKSAAILRRRRAEFNALMTKEAGKPYAEADGDTAEAIDFLEYYARQMLRMTRTDDYVLSRKPIERNEFRYIPLGVGAVITPWNFPLAILTGMTTSAVVTGNTVLLKPAITTQVIAYKLVEVLEEAGLPRGVVNLIPGEGPEIGEFMVKHPKTAFVNFTGSKAVGTTIYEEAAKVREGQVWFKRVVAEMGGKDAILVDKTFDPIKAADLIATSAFGFSGQKCSACSRAIIHENVYDDVLKALKKRVESIQVGDPSEGPDMMGPLNDAKAFKKVTDYIKIGQEEGTLLVGGHSDDSRGYFVHPTVFKDVSPYARIMQEEIFGPVLAVCKVSSFEEGLDVANNTEYGLTGSVLSLDRAKLELARTRFHVGNLYFNRTCTGSIVGYQPFGGFNMSGTDSKAGGPDYLLNFMQGKTITENY